MRKRKATKTPARKSAAQIKRNRVAAGLAPDHETHQLPSGRVWPYITTAHHLIEALGGCEAVAKICHDIDPQKVREWALTGEIPPGLHFRLFVRAWAMGEVVSPEVFGTFQQDRNDETKYSLIGALTHAREERAEDCA